VHKDRLIVRVQNPDGRRRSIDPQMRVAGQFPGQKTAVQKTPADPGSRHNASRRGTFVRKSSSGRHAGFLAIFARRSLVADDVVSGRVAPPVAQLCPLARNAGVRAGSTCTISARLPLGPNLVERQHVEVSPAPRGIGHRAASAGSADENGAVQFAALRDPSSAKGKENNCKGRPRSRINGPAQKMPEKHNGPRQARAARNGPFFGFAETGLPKSGRYFRQTGAKNAPRRTKKC